MRRQRNFLPFISLAAAIATPAFEQTIASEGGPGSGVTNRATSIPELTGVWTHPAFPWFEPPASGPGPVTNKSRWPQRPMDASGTLALPPLPPGVEGVSDYDQLVGDYTNPILQPWAAEVVKKFGEMSLAGITYGNSSNQCWPMPMLFVYKQSTVRPLQQPDSVVLIYNSSDVRRVRVNDRHPEPLTPSWYGDSVGHYEGDTLVIDTVGDNFGNCPCCVLGVLDRLSLAAKAEPQSCRGRQRNQILKSIFHWPIFPEIEVGKTVGRLQQV